jgi:FHA domain
VSAESTHLRLEVISGIAPGNTILVEDELVIGRHAPGAGRLSEDEEISRQHARISRELTGDYAIEDLGSSNGTFVNGLRIQSPRLLALGDSIETGATTLVVREIGRPEPVESAAAASEPVSDRRSAPTVFARVPAAQQATPVPALDLTPGMAPEPVAAAEPDLPTTDPPVPVEPVGRTPRVALRLEIDFDAREAQIVLGDGEEALRMVLENGHWRTGTAGPDSDC